MKRIAVFGAGAVGSVLAARLARSGLDVAIVARPAHAAAIRAHGLRLEEGAAASTVALSAHETADDAIRRHGPHDLVIATLKAHALSAAARDLRALAGGAPIIFVVNGIPWWYARDLGEAARQTLEKLDPRGQLRASIDPSQIVGGIIRLPSELLAPGHVRANGRGDSLTLAAPGDARPGRLAQIAALLDGRCGPVMATGNAAGEIWRKLLANLPSSLLTTLSGALSSEVLGCAALERSYRQIVAEGLAVARACGVALDIDVDRQVALGRRVRHPPSILQDLLAGKRLEIDAQLGSVIELARHHGVAAPLTETLTALLALHSAHR